MKSKDNQLAPVAEQDEFKGYTLDELRYQRALLLVKREFLREKAMKEVAKIKEHIPGMGSSSGNGIPAKGVLGKLVNGLDWADYLMLGFQAWRIGKKLGGKFRRKQ